MVATRAAHPAQTVEGGHEVMGRGLGVDHPDLGGIAGRPLGLTHAARPVDDQLDVEGNDSAS